MANLLITPAGGGSVATDAIFDAKGDLPVGTGANTASRLAVGANDTVLVAASGEATGAKWSATLAGLTLTAPVVTGLCFASAYNSAAVVLTNSGTYYKVTFNTENFDVGGGYDGANSKFVVPTGKAGYYVLHTKAYIYAYSGDFLCGISIYKNGAEISNSRVTTPAPAMPETLVIAHLNATDYIETFAACYTTGGQVYNGGAAIGDLSIQQISQD